MAVIVYDVSEEKTFVNVDNWLKEVQMYSNYKVTLVLVANKTDLIKEYNFEKMFEYAKINKMMFFATSAKNN